MWDAVSKSLIAVLDGSDPKKGDISYELLGIFKAIPGMARQLGNRIQLTESIENACERFKLVVAEDGGLTGRLAKKAIDAIINAEA